MSTIDIRKEHKFDLEQAQQVADDLARDLAEKFSVDYGWDGDVLHFERSGCDGHIEVDEQCVHVVARLDFFASFLKPAVEKEIHRYLDEHFT